jgi:hypothetical protein
MKVDVYHWRYDDGWAIDEFADTIQYSAVAKGYFDEQIRGWHCRVYTDDDREFKKWMLQNMKGKYDATSRFNSGNPMITVWIESNEDATMFKMVWM